MTTASRANVVSSFTVDEGAMIEETYAVLARGTSSVRSARTSTASATRTSSARRAPRGSRRRQGAEPSLRARRPRPPARDLAQAWLPARRVEAAPPLAHDPRRVPRPRLPRELALHRLRGRGLPHRARGPLRDVPGRHRQARRHRPSTRGPSRPRSACRGLLKIAADFGLLTGAAVKEFARTTCPSAASSTCSTRCATRKRAPARMSRPSGACS
jgi:hypothetical protein